ncbi:MAG: M28 family peptidase [Deltaproteobacteria bacterium]|nr:M28 family peptidase [Deltaproteobacteria bacterium]
MPANGQAVAGSADKALLYGHVKFLSTIHPRRNHAYPEALDKVAAYIRKSFEASGCSVSEQVFKPDGIIEYRNVICSLGPEDGALLVFGAHYDVEGYSDGADDNASGVAGVLELARLLGGRKDALKSRVQLVAYTLEEPPYFSTDMMGSAVHAKSLKESGQEVRLMVAVEMIGYFTSKPKSQRYPAFFLKWFYPSTGDFIAVVGRWGQGSIVKRVHRIMANGSSVPVSSLGAPRSLTGIDFSDHRSFWKYGFPAVMVTDTAFFRNPNYHELGDRVETLDFDKMSGVVDALLRVALEY